jgi:hypothetical protein
MGLERSQNRLGCFRWTLQCPTRNPNLKQFRIKSLYHVSHRSFVLFVITKFSLNQLSCFGDTTYGEAECTGKMQLRRSFMISSRRRITGSYCPFVHNFILIFETNIVTEIIWVQESFLLHFSPSNNSYVHLLLILTLWANMAVCLSTCLCALWFHLRAPCSWFVLCAGRFIR